uniref:beta strand repeat-containing protein n=1 Tax=Emticicia oligotrophica TaxID=312279 RepID=UPI0030EBAC0A
MKNFKKTNQFAKIIQKSYFWAFFVFSLFESFITYGQACTGSLGSPVVKQDFGTNGGTFELTTYSYQSTECPNDGNYSLQPKTVACFSGNWNTLNEDHTPNDINGNLMIVNADPNPSKVFYIQTVNNLCPNTTYELSAYIINLLRQGVSGAKPNIKFKIEKTDGTLIQEYSTGNIDSPSSNPVTPSMWGRYATFFTTSAGMNSVVLKLINNAAGGGGNDLAIDDIAFSPCGPLLSSNSGGSNTKIVCSGTNVTLSTNLSGGYTSPEYQWQESSNNLDWSNIAGQTNSTYTFLSSNTGSTVTAKYFRSLASEAGNINNVNCRIESSVTLIKTIPQPIVNQPVNLTVCNNTLTTVNFTGIATRYNYTSSANIGITTTNVSATNNNASFTFTAQNNGTSPVSSTITVTPIYQQDSICQGEAKTFTITVNPTPTVEKPSNQVICNNTLSTTVNFNGAVPGTIYNWTNNTPSIGLASSGSGNIGSFTAINSGTNPITATITVTPSYTNNGRTCDGTPQTFTITVNPTPTVEKPSNQVNCNNTSSSAINFSGAVAGTIYNWTNNTPSIGLATSGLGNIGSFTAINTGSNPITATITATPSYTNAGRTCEGIPQDFTFTVNPTPTVTKPVNQTICDNSSTTLVNFSGTVLGTTYNWTNNTASIGLAANGSGNIGSFIVTNTGATPVTSTIIVTPSYTNAGKTCEGTPQTFSITANPRPQAFASPNELNICTGDKITINLSDSKGVSGTTTFSWNRDNLLNITGVNGGSSNPISGVLINTTNSTQSTNFIITATTQAGCVNTTNAIVNVTPQLLVSISGNTFFCGTGNLNNSTLLTALVSGGNSSYSYQWYLNGNTISGATSANYQASTEGNYWVEVKSEYCAKNSNTLTVNPPYNLGAAPTVTPNPVTICQNSTASFIASSTSTLGTISWYTSSSSNSTIATGNSFTTPTLNSSQTYYVSRVYPIPFTNPIVTCETSRTEVQTIINPDVVAPIAIGNTSICKGESAILSITNTCTGGEITWKNQNNVVIGTGNELTVFPIITTSYTATCKIGNCISDESNTVIINVLSPPSISIIPTNITCFNKTDGSIIVNVSGGKVPYTYLWNNNATTPVINNLTEGNYSVVVTDDNKCTSTGNVVITEPTPIELSVSGTNLTCTGNNSGQVTLTASGGTGTLSYLWDTGATSKDLINVSAGTYSVRVQDSNGCRASTSVVITEPTPIELSVSGTNLTCTGNNSGQVTLTASGGTGTLSYLWDTGATSKDLINVSAGTYSVRVQDSNGCRASTSVVITEPTPIELSVSGTNLTCTGNNSGQVTLTASGGTGTLSYLWDTGATSKDLINVSAGTYSVTVQDSNGCRASTSVTLIEPTPIELSVSGTNLTCTGNNSGQVTLTASGGTGTLSYLWDTGATSKDLINVSAGTYSVTVQDSNGCRASTSVVITEPTPIELSVSGTNLTCTGNNSGQVILTASGGTGTLSYLW